MSTSSTRTRVVLALCPNAKPPSDEARGINGRMSPIGLVTAASAVFTRGINTDSFAETIIRRTCAFDSEEQHRELRSSVVIDRARAGTCVARVRVSSSARKRVGVRARVLACVHAGVYACASLHSYICTT